MGLGLLRREGSEPEGYMDRAMRLSRIPRDAELINNDRYIQFSI